MQRQGKVWYATLKMTVYYTMAGGGLDWDGLGYSKSTDVKLEHLSYMRLGPGPSIYISQMIDHAIRVVSVKQEPSWIAYDIHMTPMHSIYEYGVAGLEPYIKETIPKILKGYLPKQKKSFGKRFNDFNKNIAEYFKERPLLFAILLLFGVRQPLSWEFRCFRYATRFSI